MDLPIVSGIQKCSINVSCHYLHCYKLIRKMSHVGRGCRPWAPSTLQSLKYAKYARPWCSLPGPPVRVVFATNNLEGWGYVSPWTNVWLAFNCIKIVESLLSVPLPYCNTLHEQASTEAHLCHLMASGVLERECEPLRSTCHLSHE